MNSLVKDARNHPDVAVTRFGFINANQTLGSKIVSAGDSIRGIMNRVHGTDRFMLESNGSARSLGKLVFSFRAFESLENSGFLEDEVGPNKLGLAVVANEVVYVPENDTHISVSSLVHADRRYDDRANCMNVVSLCAPFEGEGRAFTLGMRQLAQRAPKGLVGMLHEELGEANVPHDLHIGSVVTYDHKIDNYFLRSQHIQT